MKKQAGPSSVALHSEPELDAFINGFYASVVGELLSCYYPYGGYRKNKEYSKSWISLCIHVRWLGKWHSNQYVKLIWSVTYA